MTTRFRSCLMVGLGCAGLLLGGCEEREAEATPREPGSPSSETPAEVEVPSVAAPELPLEPGRSAVHERRDPVTPGEDGIIEPNEDRVLMPPESLEEGIDHPHSRDQLERDRTEEASPQGAY